jgi:hypothetical protein
MYGMLGESCVVVAFAFLLCLLMNGRSSKGSLNFTNPVLASHSGTFKKCIEIFSME